MSAKPLKNLLKSGSGGALGNLVRRAQNMGELTHILKAELDPSLADHLLSANLREDGKLVLVCETSAWAARLRFEADALLAAARGAGHAVDSLQVSVARGGDRPQA